MIFAVVKSTQFMQLREEAWKKIQDFNGVWTRDLAIPVRCSNQLSYEATDVGSRSIVGSYMYGPLKEIGVNYVYEINLIFFFRLLYAMAKKYRNIKIQLESEAQRTKHRNEL